MHGLAAAVVVLALNSGAVPDGPGFEVGARAGFGVDTGRYLVQPLDGPRDTPRLDRMAPLWLDLGYRFTPAVLVGAYFQYTLGRVDSSALPPAPLCSTTSVCSASGYVMRVGAEVQYRFTPASKVSPWVALGAGYVSHEVEITIRTAAPVTSPGGPIISIDPVHIRGTSTGLDLGVHAGLDARATEWMTVGPYVAVFSGESASMEVGLRCRFAL
jgi:hypothetical protein